MENWNNNFTQKAGVRIMWKSIKMDHVRAIEKCAAEFEVWATRILPYAKMKVKIYEQQNGFFTGYTDVQVIRKFDNKPEGAVGHGKTVEEALEDTINNFLQIVESDYPKDQYPHGLSEENIEYIDFNDF